MVRTEATAIGDIVTLKSGGPQMTVESVEAALPGAVAKGINATAGMLSCIWHDAAGVIQQRAFWPHTLITAPDSPEQVAADKKAADAAAAKPFVPPAPASQDAHVN